MEVDVRGNKSAKRFWRDVANCGKLWRSCDHVSHASFTAICTRSANDGAECQRPAAVGITEEPSGSVYTLFPRIHIPESSVKMTANGRVCVSVLENSVLQVTIEFSLFHTGHFYKPMSSIVSLSTPSLTHIII